VPMTGFAPVTSCL